MIAWVNKGIVLGKSGNYKESIECFDKALELDPKNAIAWKNKGIAFGILGNLEESSKCFDKAAELDPKDE